MPPARYHPAGPVVLWADVASMISAAVLDRMIGASPCAGVKSPALGKHSHYIPTADQVRAVTGALLERCQAIAWLAAGYGWRHNEILGAELDALGFLRRTAEVRQQLLAISGEPTCLAPPKTPTSYRVSELPDVAALAVAWHLKQFPRRRAADLGLHGPAHAGAAHCGADVHDQDRCPRCIRPGRRRSGGGRPPIRSAFPPGRWRARPAAQLRDPADSRGQVVKAVHLAGEWPKRQEQRAR